MLPEVRLGISLTTSYPPGSDPRRVMAGLVERARAAELAGLDSLFVGDHHATGPGLYLQNVPALARILAEWGDRPAGCLFMLPLWNPTLLAEQVGTLAAIARGRFIVQCAIGAGGRQFAELGASLRERVPAFEAALARVRGLWASPEVVAPVPAEPVEVWVGGAVPAAIDRAARLGDGFLAAAGLVPEVAAEHARLFRAACARHDRAPTAVAIRVDVFVGADAAHAEAVAGPVLAAGYRGFDPRSCVVGSAAQVAASLRSLGDMGYTDVIVRHLSVPQAEVLASTARLGDVRALVARP